MHRELCEHFGKTVPGTNKQHKWERDCKTCSVPYWDLVVLFYHQVLCVQKLITIGSMQIILICCFLRLKVVFVWLFNCFAT